jgi:hypothetical protein
VNNLRISTCENKNISPLKKEGSRNKNVFTENNTENTEKAIGSQTYQISNVNLNLNLNFNHQFSLYNFTAKNAKNSYNGSNKNLLKQTLAQEENKKEQCNFRIIKTTSGAMHQMI